MTAAAPLPARLLAKAQLRPITAEDADGVMQLFERHGWPLRSRAGWIWALFDNPARRASGAEAGWVLESDGRVVGFLGNVPAAFQLNGWPVLAATCTSLLVDEVHRARSISLVRAFAAQPGVTMAYSATANAQSAPLYKAFRFRSCDDARANQRLRWIISRTAIARALLERVNLGWLLARRKWVGWFQPKDASANPSGLHVDRVGRRDLTNERNSSCRDAWDVWARELACGPGLWPDRSAQTLSWRLSDPDQAPDEFALWALRDSHGSMLGLCMARRLPRVSGQPAKAELMDLALLPGLAADAAALLLSAAKHWARASGAAVLDAKRWTGLQAAELERLGARCDPLPPDALWMRTQPLPDGVLALDWNLWSMTGCDSDDWFNSLRKQRPADMQDSAALSHHDRAWPSSSTNSSSVSTEDGSKRSMSSV